MAIIGYSQLMKEIFDISKSSVEILMEKLAKRKVSGLRLKVLKRLAKEDSSTISTLLKSISENNTGGTYKTIRNFFQMMEKDRILVSESKGRHTYWSFTEDAEPLKRYLQK